MGNNKAVLEGGLNQVVKTLKSMESFIDQLYFAVPKPAKHLIIKVIKSKEIVEGIKEKRPPKLLSMGRSGVGKSSLLYKKSPFLSCIL